MEIKERKSIPTSIARDLLEVSHAEFSRLIAERVVEVTVERTGRGSEMKTDIASIERAARQPR